MLVTLAVSNFRSFAATQTFSLIASTRLDNTHEDHAVPIPDSDERVLRVGVIYGANGAGKSNLLVALRCVRHIARTLADAARHGPSSQSLPVMTYAMVSRYTGVRPPLARNTVRPRLMPQCNIEIESHTRTPLDSGYGFPEQRSHIAPPTAGASDAIR